MIEPWQVWPVEVTDNDVVPMLVVSSELHIELTSGRLVTTVPLTTANYGLNHHVRVVKDIGDTGVWYVMTDQLRTVSSLRFRSPDYVWDLGLSYIPSVRRALRHMVDFA